jgi:adenine specific DNA methylase Mod
VPYRLLRCDNGLSTGDSDAGNLLVQGDNLLALKALLPYYAGKVKCIYIDPPYNTGNENWVYNDGIQGDVVAPVAQSLNDHGPGRSSLRSFLFIRTRLSLDKALFLII